MRRSPLRVAALAAVGLALLTGAGLLALPSHADTTDPCTPDVAAKLQGLSRAIVPVGSPALRAFAIEVSGHVTVSGVQFTTTGGVKAAPVAVKGAYGLRLTASRAGAFDVQATW